MKMLRILLCIERIKKALDNFKTGRLTWEETKEEVINALDKESFSRVKNVMQIIKEEADADKRKA